MANNCDSADDDSPFMLDEERNLGWLGTWSDEDEAFSNDSQLGARLDRPTKVTYNQATDEAWEVAKEEIKIVCGSLMSLLALKERSDFSLFRLMDLLYGPKSRL